MPATICQTFATDASCSGSLPAGFITSRPLGLWQVYFSFFSALFVPGLCEGLAILLTDKGLDQNSDIILSQPTPSNTSSLDHIGKRHNIHPFLPSPVLTGGRSPRYGRQE